MASGFKIADAYVEVHLDTDSLHLDAAKVSSAVDKDFDAIGKSAGSKMAKGVGQTLTGGLDPEMDRAGQSAGSTLSRGFQYSMVRNSPLIAAAVGAAILAGGPAITAAASLAFGGLAAVIAAQSPQVKAAWGGLWQEIKSSSAADAAGLTQVFVNIAGQVGQAFQALRPQLRDIFDALGPQIQTVTDGLLGLVRNAMPGLTQLIQNAGPAMDGFRSLLESVGTGLGKMFSILSEHAPAAGQAFKAIGDIIGALLPILGELMGQGAELASIILPPLAAILKVVAGALEALGPILPVVAAGFTAMKVVGLLSGPLESMSGGLAKVAQNLAFASYGAGPFAGAAGKMSTAVSGASKAVSALGGALPIIGLVAAGVSYELDKIDDAAQKMAAGLRKGGADAEAAKAQLADLGKVSGGIEKSGLPDWALKLGAIFGGPVASGMYEAGAEIRGTKEALDEQWKSMTPLEQSASKMSEWTATLATRMKDFGAGSEEVEAAQRRLTYWTQEHAKAQAEQNIAVEQYIPSAEALKNAQDDLANALRLGDVDMATEALGRYYRESEEAAIEQQQLEMAIKGVTQAMADQVDQARSAVDAQFAYEDSINGVEDAQQAYNEAVAKYGANSEEASRASLQLSEALQRQVEAAGRAATSDLPASLDDTQKKLIGAKAELDEFNKLIEAGFTLSPSQEEYRQQLIRITGGANEAKLAQAELAASISQLGYKVTSLPDGKTIKIDAPSDALTKKLQDLGFTVTHMPDGSIQVTADTDQAKGNLGELNHLTAEFASSNPVSTPQVNTGPATGGFSGLFDWAKSFGQQTPTATPGVNTAPATGGFSNLFGQAATFGQQTPTATAGLNTGPFDINWAAVSQNVAILAGQTPTPVANLDSGPFTGVFNWAIGASNTLASQRPTPVANMDSGPFSSIFNWAIGASNTLAGQRPTPIASMNNGPFAAAFGAAMGQAATLGGQRPTATADMYAGIFASVFGYVMGLVATIAAQRPSANVYANDYASGTLGGILRSILAIPLSRTVTVTTVAKNMLAAGGPVGFDDGGHVSGPGSGTSDSIPAMLSNGEFVVRAAMVKKYGMDFLTAVNQGTLAMKASGGLAQMGGMVVRPRPAAAGSGAFADPGTTVNIREINVSIPASDLAEMQSIQDFFNRIGQEARRTSLTGVR